MSIAPPSDIVLDVAQAADPQRLKIATAKLSAMAGGGSVEFDAALATAKTTPSSVRTAAVTVPDDRATRVARQQGSPYQKFEAMVLQTFVESMLPKNDDLYGDAASADAYRSMMAQQIAQAVAKTGRLGIAASIEKAQGAATADTDAAALAARGLARKAAAPAAAAPMALNLMPHTGSDT